MDVRYSIVQDLAGRGSHLFVGCLREFLDGDFLLAPTASPYGRVESRGNDLNVVNPGEVERLSEPSSIENTGALLTQERLWPLEC